MDTNETTIEPLEGADAPRFDNAPIGVFDSGFGGLTVAREIAKELPRESIVYLGDSARCPYGPRSLDEVDGFVQQIGAWLVERGVKLVVIACNTATAAGLAHAQRTFPVPVIGVVEPCDDAANNAKLLAELADVPDEKRTGRFVCTLVFIDEDGTETVARGTIEGRIGREERGRHGFGYDPLFLPDMFEDGRTLAEALPEEKNAVSHRGNALRQLRAKLAQGER